MANSDSRPTPESVPNKPQNPRGILLGATAVLFGFVLFQAPVLYEEWQGLQRDWERSRLGAASGLHRHRA